MDSKFNFCFISNTPSEGVEIIRRLKSIGGKNRHNFADSSYTYYFIDLNGFIVGSNELPGGISNLNRLYEDSLVCYEGDNSGTVIKRLENLGGINYDKLTGTSPEMYYYIRDGFIHCSGILKNVLQLGKIVISKIAYEGNKDWGKAIINTLQSFGATNKNNLSGCSQGYYYYINNNGNITTTSNPPEGYQLRELSPKRTDNGNDLQDLARSLHYNSGPLNFKEASQKLNFKEEFEFNDSLDSQYYKDFYKYLDTPAICNGITPAIYNGIYSVEKLQNFEKECSNKDLKLSDNEGCCCSPKNNNITKIYSPEVVEMIIMDKVEDLISKGYDTEFLKYIMNYKNKKEMDNTEIFKKDAFIPNSIEDVTKIFDRLQRLGGKLQFPKKENRNYLTDVIFIGPKNVICTVPYYKYNIEALEDNGYTLRDVSFNPINKVSAGMDTSDIFANKVVDKQEKVVISNNKKENKMKNVFGGLMGKFKSQFVPEKVENLKISSTGLICVPINNEYVAIDANNNLVAFTKELCFDCPMYTINKPSDQVAVGDIIKDGNSYGKVIKKKEDGSLSVLSYSGTTKNRKAVKDFILNSAFATVVVNMFSQSTSGGFNPMMLMMMDEDNNVDMKDMMMMQMMSGQGNQAGGMNPMMMMMMMKGDGEGEGNKSSMMENLMMMQMMQGNTTANPFGSMFGGQTPTVVPEVKAETEVDSE